MGENGLTFEIWLLLESCEEGEDKLNFCNDMSLSINKRVVATAGISIMTHTSLGIIIMRF